METWERAPVVPSLQSQGLLPSGADDSQGGMQRPGVQAFMGLDPVGAPSARSQELLPAGPVTAP